MVTFSKFTTLNFEVYKVIGVMVIIDKVNRTAFATRLSILFSMVFGFMTASDIDNLTTKSIVPYV